MKKNNVFAKGLTSEGIEERLERIKKLAKRFPKMTQELEIEALDMMAYAKPLSEGGFPATHLIQVENRLTKAHTELSRIIKEYQSIFALEIGEKNESS